MQILCKSGLHMGPSALSPLCELGVARGNQHEHELHAAYCAMSNKVLHL